MSNQTGSPQDPRDEHGTLDVAIDRAVRRMMAAEPPPGLRHRVLRRLEGGAAPAWGFFPRFAMAGGALAIVVLGSAVVMRPGPPAAPAPQSAAVAPAPAAPVAVEPLTVPPQAAPVPPPTVRAPRRERLPEPPQMAEVFGTPDARVSATSVPPVALDDPATPYTEAGTTFRSPIAGLPPLRLESLRLPLVQVKPPRIDPQ
jgi:hypothetical protein